MHTPQKTVAVVIPLSNREELTPDEEISLRHLVHFLGQYDKFMVMPQSLKVDYPGFGIKRFPNKFFGSLVAHTKLMLSRTFYQAFQEYKYILLYHLDALVFSDQLLQWCATDFDYIGAPFLRVIDSPTYAVDPATYWEAFCAAKPKYLQYLNLPRKYLKHLHVFNSARWEMSRMHLVEWRHDDLFWSDEAINYYPAFRVPAVDLGLRFAFEVAPRQCFELNNHTLPFGCHAWPRYDRSFWEPYLLKKA
jgi:hypothetical protein